MVLGLFQACRPIVSPFEANRTQAHLPVIGALRLTIYAG
jgi:hypothetical protein